MPQLDSDETLVLPEKNSEELPSPRHQSNPDRPIQISISHERSSKGNINTTFSHEMNTINENQSSSSPPKYGYLEHIQMFKPLCRPDDKSLPKKVRDFYEDQLDLITSIEDILLPKSDETVDHETAYQKRQKKIIKWLTIITLITNIVLVIVKLVGAIISKSLSVISSVVESTIDLSTNLILIWTARKIKKRDSFKYPGGRKRLEPIAIIILSVIMCSASVQVIIESVTTIVDEVDYFENQHNASSTKTLPQIDMSVVPIIAMCLTVVSKAVLFFLCYRIKNPTMYALAEDNRNDVASNLVALACGLIASNALRDKIKKEAVVVDPAGAILISVYIIIAWILQANRQIRHLSGLAAQPSFLQRLTHVIYNYRPDVVTKIDSIQAAHHGTDYFVEVDIGLPGSMPLAMAHDIGSELQTQLENIDEIERAFVHLDFEFSHMPANEHKSV